MRRTNENSHFWRRALCGLGVGTALGVAGCQVDIGGQTLPSAYYQDDDIQYFPAGPEFKLTNEAAAQKEFQENEAAELR